MGFYSCLVRLSLCLPSLMFYKYSSCKNCRGGRGILINRPNVESWHFVLQCIGFIFRKKETLFLPLPHTQKQDKQGSLAGTKGNGIRHMFIHRMTLSWAQHIYGNDFHNLKQKSSLLVIWSFSTGNARAWTQGYLHSKYVHLAKLCSLISKNEI